MAELDWSILRSNGPVDIAGNFARGYQMGSAIVDKIHERNALASLAQQPNNPSALATLYQVNPEMGQYFEKRGAQLTATKTRASIAQQYATDPKGGQAAAVAAGDFDLADQFGKLDDTQQKKTADFWAKAGPVAYQLKQIKDPAQRQAFWAQAKPILQSEAVDPTMLEHFDPTNDTQLDAAIVTSQKVSDLIGQNKIEWHQQGENPSFATNAMGVPVGTANPAAGAVSGNLPRVSDTAGYNALPPGAHYLDPSGHVRVKGGQSVASPAGGFLHE